VEDTLLEEVGGEITQKDHNHRWMLCVLNSNVVVVKGGDSKMKVTMMEDIRVGAGATYLY
jgi:hypothetical protein